MVEQLAKEIQVKVDWKEVTFANATIALRRGDFDLFGSSLTYLVPRALVVDFVGPYYSKGSLLLCHKDNADRFKTAADANKAVAKAPSAIVFMSVLLTWRDQSISSMTRRSCETGAS